MRLGHMQELFLRETVVSWIGLRLASTVPSKAWHRGGVDEINSHLGVEGLCKSFPKRLDLAIEAKGGRIPK